MTDSSVLDASLDKVKEADRVVACSADPANFAGVAAVTLAVNATPSHGANEDYASGRQFTTAAATGITATATGTAAYYAYVDDTLSVLLRTYDITNVEVTSGTAYNFSSVTVQQPE